MAKVRNYHVYGSVEYINRLKEDYEFLGKWVRLEGPGHLVVLALPPKKETKKVESRGKDRRPGGVRKEAPSRDR
jgi:hypothetical protein